jgi:hypothetical protein
VSHLLFESKTPNESVAVCYDRRFSKTVLTAWGLLVLYTSLFCIVLPLIVGLFNKSFQIRMYDLGYDMPFVFAVFLLGWFYPLLASSAGYGFKYILRRFTERQS